MSYKLSIKKKMWLTTIHVLSVVCSLGGVMCMLLLGLYMKSDNGEQLYYTLIGGAIANIVFLVFMTAISYFKPFGKIKSRGVR